MSQKAPAIKTPIPGYDLKEYVAMTDVGVRRSHNQDAYGMLTATTEDVWRERGHVFLVADGMGAHAVGEMASDLASDLILHTYQKHANLGPVAALRRAFQEANTKIHQRGQQNREFQGMGTTSTAVILRSEGAWIGHVGDSRAYRIRGNQVEQISFDHSLQWELARRQQVSPDRIAGVPSNVIVRSLGPEANVQVDIEGPHPVLPGDIYVLCSDGLSNQLTDQELGAAFTHLPLAEACKFLIDLANLRGGPDNITVVSVRLEGEAPKAGLSGTQKLIRPPKSPISFKKLPWPSIAVGSGILLSILALFLVISEWRWPAIFIFCLAAGILVTGIIGLVGNYRRELNSDGADEETSTPAQIYRQASCTVDASLLERMMQTEKGLIELARQKNWQLNWDQHNKHHSASILAFQKGQLDLAFKEQCRAMAILLDVLREHRQRDEHFKPNW